MFGLFKKKKEAPQTPQQQFPPVPDWQPSIVQSIENVIDRVRYYTEGKNDFAVFPKGTVVLLPLGLSEGEAMYQAREALGKVFGAHPDMTPSLMKDGNIVVQYNHNVLNVVLEEIAMANFPEIDKQHQRALVRDEVLYTNLGPNQFDAFGKKALFGRCFLFMDAQWSSLPRVERGGASRT